MGTKKALECLLVTANCGSVFEDPSRLLEKWISEFLSHVKQCKPDFLALHLQEVGGKTYEKSMEYVQQFIKMLCESNELSEYNKIRVFLDEDYNSSQNFTALGNLYFFHDSINEIKIWNFLTHQYESVEGKTIHTGNIESVATKEKAKFPQTFFPECKWSRKGFLRTRWSIEGTTLDLINIHLFHDASNLAACEQFPSVYCKSRRRALVHTLERFHKDQTNILVPFFIFGDFNFRCDTEGVVKKLTSDLTEQRLPNLKTDHSKVQFRNAEGAIQLTVGKKEFTHVDHQIFKQDWLRQFDRELEPLQDILHEFPISFIPSYPFEEDPELPYSYMPTRCPAWCDRILMTKAGKHLIASDDDISYGIIGEGTCMGDHKPVSLKFQMKTNQGIVNKCDHDVQSMDDDDDCKENISYDLSSKLVNVCCEVCLKHFKEIMETISLPLPLIDDNRRNSRANPLTPLVSINVVDTDKNLNICMCNPIEVYEGVIEVDKFEESENICPNCRNLIKAQPSARYSLVSKQTMLGDVVVNRIDSQYLSSTYSTSGSELRKLMDPYTPESMESHSPQTEMEEPNFINNLNDTEEIPEDLRDVIKHNKIDIGEVMNEETENNHHAMDPHQLTRQLTTRLELLRRESQLENGSKGGGSDSSSQTKSSKKKCCTCAIL